MTAPAPSLTLRVGEFEGPFDLLLHLCRTNEIDLARLPIRSITDQYLVHLQSLQFQDLETAGAYLVMAATLVYLKSKLLVPPDEAEEHLDDETETLRLELEERLREYASVKALGAWLAEREAEQALVWGRAVSDLPPPDDVPLEDLSVHLLERSLKRLITEQSAGAPVIVFEGDSEREEAEFVASTIEADLSKDYAPRDFAVFYRTHAQSRVLEEALRVRNIPYVIVGGTRFYDRAEVKDLLSYLRVLMNPEDAIALLRIINVPARGIGNTTVDRLIAVTNDQKVSLSAALTIAANDPEILGQAARRKVAEFEALLTRLRAALSLPPAELAEKVLEESGYRDFLAADTSIESEGRLENLLELVGQMREFEKETEEPTLSGFLERITLASDVDGFDPDKGAVALMTVHTAKGLEFDVVFVTGLEEGTFPHQRSINDDGAMEEERRLCYVAVTRARKRLHLCRARWRRLSGQTFGGIPSRFLRDLPPDGVEHLVTATQYHDVDSEGQGPWQGRFDRDRGMGRGGFGPPAAKPAPSGEIARHYDEGAAAPGEGELALRVGMKVRHAQFGIGEVRAWQSSGTDLKVTVRFASVGAKTVLARFLAKP